MDILDLQAPPADRRISYGPEELHFGDLRLPDGAGPHPVVVVIHGGFWRSAYDLEHIGHLCAALAAAGVATWSIEYRRLGNRGGGWPGTMLDVAMGADHLRHITREFKLDLNRIVTLGHSAGGHLALWLAGRHKLQPTSELYITNSLPMQGVIALAPVADLVRGWELRLSRGVVGELMGGSPTQYPERYHDASPASLLPLGAPQVVVHGTQDGAVPYELGRDYAERTVALGDAAQLITLVGAGHFELIDPRSEEWQQVKRAVLEMLGGLAR